MIINFIALLNIHTSHNSPIVSEQFAGSFKFIVMQPLPQSSFRTLWLSLLLPRNIHYQHPGSVQASTGLSASQCPGSSLHPLLIPRACQLTQFKCCSVPLLRCLHWAPLLPSLPLYWPLEARAYGSSVDWKDRTLEPQTCIWIVTMRPSSSHFVSLDLGFLLCKADTIHMTCWVWQLEMMCAVSRTVPSMLSK